MPQQFIKLYNDVSDFIPVDDEKLIIKKGTHHERHKLLTLDLKTGNEYEMTQEGHYKLQFLKSKNGNFWINTWYAESLIIDPVSNKAEELKLLVADFISPDKILGMKIENSDPSDLVFALFNCKTERFDWRYEEKSTLYYLTDNSLFFISFKNKRRVVLKVDTDSGKKLWSFSIPDDKDVEFQKAHGIFEDSIIVSTTVGNIYFLDSESGTEKKYVETPCHNLHTSNYDGSKIILFDLKKYFEIDLASTQTTEVEMEDLLFRTSIPDLNTQGRYYFTADSKETNHFRHLIGAFDTIEKEIIWVEKIELPKEDSLKKLGQLNSKLYALTHEGNLYIKTL